MISSGPWSPRAYRCDKMEYEMAPPESSGRRISPAAESLSYADDDIQLKSAFDGWLSARTMSGTFLKKLSKRSRTRYGARDDLMRAAMAKLFRIPVGKFSYGYEQLCYKRSMVSQIGAFCSFGPNIAIAKGNHPSTFVSTSPAFYMAGWGIAGETLPDAVKKNEPITIGHDVWIGLNVTLVTGIRIGHGAIVAAGAVVAKDVPPYAIVGGVPARIIRYRFDPATIERLLESQWWTWPDEKLRTQAKDFLAPERFMTAKC